jgi:phytoene dehydrogenase-like protein
MANFEQQPMVLIVGGGTGGLAAALPLSRKGSRVRVSEQANDLGNRCQHPARPQCASDV